MDRRWDCRQYVAGKSDKVVDPREKGKDERSDSDSDR